MDNKALFNQFNKQSKKGIIIIYLNLLYKILKIFWVLLFLFIQKFSNFSESNIQYIYLGLTFILIVLMVRAVLIFKNFQYKIDNNHFILKSGILIKTNTSIPFDRIQNINFKQNIVQQIINVFEVNIETAGSSKAEISIKALSFKDAKALKNAITITETNLHDTNSKELEKPLLKINFSQLIKVGLTENHLQSLLLFLAVLGGFFQQFNEFSEGFLKLDFFDSYYSEHSLNLSTNFLIITILFLLFIIVSIFSSLVRVFLKHFNLSIFLKNNALEIDQGLITKKSILLKKDKVQHITVSHNPLKKRLGIFFITFKQAISGKVKKKEDKIIKIIGCRRTQITAIKNLLYANENLEGLIKNFSNSYFKIRMYLQSLFLLFIINMGFFFIFNTFVILSANALLFPLMICLITQKFKKQYYLLSNEIIVIGSGIIETHKTYLPLFKVQNIKIKQSFFQSKKKVMDIVFQTASGKIIIPCINEDEAFKLYNNTLFKVATSIKSWM